MNIAYVNPFLGISCYLHNNAASCEIKTKRKCVFVCQWEDFAVYSQTCPISSFFLCSLCQSFPATVICLTCWMHAVFHGDNAFMFYFLEWFPLAVKPGLVLCCIQLASHRQQRWSSTGQTKKSWIGHFTDEHSVPLFPSRNQGYVNPYSLEKWCNAKHKIFKIMTHRGFWEMQRLVKDGAMYWMGGFTIPYNATLN